MRLVMTLLVRDEEDILEDNLEFHRSMGVDHVVVTDNLSTDRTPQILERYAAQGWLTWRRETDDDYSQYRWVTRMAREAVVHHGADWVINNDADEFWLPRRGDLKRAFAAVPDDVGVVSVSRADFLPRPEQPGRFCDRLTVRTQWGEKYDGTRLLPKVAHRADPQVEVAQGNHEASGPLLGTASTTDEVEILHFPVRTYAQYEHKTVVGGRAYRRNTDLPRNMGKRRRRDYKRYLQGTLRDWYDAHLLSDDQVAAGLTEGRLIEDRRLQELLASPGSRPGVLRRLLRRAPG